MSILGIIAFIVLLSVIIVVHELGHMLVAKHFGVYCHEFSLGMGPVLYQKKGKETTYSIRAIPFGGYVLMAGEEDGSQDDETEWLKEVPENRKLTSKPTYQKVLVMLAGVIMNFLLAWVIFIGISLANGYRQSDPLPVVYEVIENSPASEAGLQKDDEIISARADGEEIKPGTQYDLLKFVQLHHDTLEITVSRDGQEFETTITPEYDKESQGYTLGYIVAAYLEPIPWYMSFVEGTKDLWDSTVEIYQSLGLLLSGQALDQLSGPVGILNVTARTAELGLNAYLSLVGLISVNVGIFNLIPIPALDGGRVLVLLIEKILRRKINTALVENVIMISFVLLLGLMIFATYNDILRLVGM